MAWPPLIKPMLAVPGALPLGEGWAYEFKWDGVRATAYLDGTGAARLMSRNDLDVSRSYPELAVLGERLGTRKAVLDGEIVTLDRHGAPSFAALQRRMHVREPTEALVEAAPVRYVVFDLLYLGRSLVSKPWHDRRAALDGLGLDAPPVTVAAYFTSDPEAVLDTARERGLEGVVSKRTDAAYQPGRRSPAWTKTALIQTTEVIVAGYKAGAGRRAGTVGSLVLAAHDRDGHLVYIGGVGTGFTQSMLDELGRRLRPLHRATSPLDAPVPTADARGVQWVRPTIVGEVVYRTVTPDGRLRHSSWRGLRPDREPSEVTLLRS